jgi:hypothetical protein
MIERLDVDIQKLAFARQGEAYLEARRNCLRCQHKTECSLWLREEERPPDLPGFCPNLELFQSLKAL